MSKHPLNGSLELFACGHTLGCYTVGFGNHHEVGIEQRCLRESVVEKQRLPLAHITEEVVVEKHNLHIGAVLHYRAQLLYSHLQTAVAGIEHDSALRRSHLGSDGCRESESHSAQTSGCDNRTGLGEARVTCGEHLVLAHIGHHDSLMPCSLAYIVDHLAHRHTPLCGVHLAHNHLLILYAGRLIKLGKPLPVGILFHQRQQSLQGSLGIAVDSGVGGYVLVELGCIDIDMHDSGLWSIGFYIAGDAVVETHAYGYDEVGTVGVDIRADIAVHTEHSLVQRMCRRDCR